MTELTILFQAPAILTKDRKWAEDMHRVEPGSIVVLPEDAVLVVLPPKSVEEELS